MIRVPRKLIEVALPLEDINESAIHEKKIRQGHPSSMHHYWARRPLAAARAVLFAQLVNDPGGARGWAPGNSKAAADTERERLFDIIRELSKWENVCNKKLLERANEEILRSWQEVRAANGEDLRLFPEEHPPIQDPFAGGGAIPLEAQRLGLQSIASDLNPVSSLICHAMIDIPVRFANCQSVGPAHLSAKQSGMALETRGILGLCEDIKSYGETVKQAAHSKIGRLYPQVTLKSGAPATVNSWIWTRTVASPNPIANGAHVPLVKSFALSKKKGKCAWVEYEVDSAQLEYMFQVKTGTSLPDVAGTVGRGGARCILTGSLIPLAYIREQGKRGLLRYRLMATVLEGDRGRQYVPPSRETESLATSVRAENYPTGKIDHWVGCTNCVVYGYENFEDLYTPRQLVALTTFSDCILDIKNIIVKDAIRGGFSDDSTPLHTGGSGAVAYAEAIMVYLTCALDKMADLGNAFCGWESIAQCPRHLFGKQAIPMVWDFAEANPFSNSSGSWSLFVGGILKGMGRLAANAKSECLPGVVFQSDAQLSDAIVPNAIISTDPPYYDNVPYSNLSDFFYLWMRRTLRDVYPDMYSTINVPKMPELVANPFRHGDKESAETFFLEGMTQAIRNMAEHSHPAFPVTIYYAFKASETRGAHTSSSGWEAFLSAVIRAGFVITGTWPLRTENASRMRGHGSNVLGTSIILVCRIRENSVGSITRRQLQRELRERVPEALQTMIGGVSGHSPIAPVDLAQAAIGPGVAVYSKYNAVLNQDGSTMNVHDALILINREITDYLNPESGQFDADTLFCSSWFDQYGWSTGPFTDANTLAQGKGTSVDGVKEAGVVVSGGGNVQLLKWDQYPPDWDPRYDNRIPVWEACHHMIRALKTEGEASSGALLAGMPERAESIRQLAYHLYTLCERKKWAEDARAYNELITSWHAIIAMSYEAGHTGTQVQLNLES